MNLVKLFDLLCDKCSEIYSGKFSYEEMWNGKERDFYNLPCCLKSVADFFKSDKTITNLEISSDEITVPNCRIKQTSFDDGTMYLALSVYWVKKYNVRRYIFSPMEIRYFASPFARTDFILTEDVVLYRTNNKSVPATVKSLSVLPTELQEILFRSYTESLIWKDCIRDNFYIPAPINKLDCYHNKKEYCEKIFGVYLPSSVSTINFKALYAICCCSKYIKEEKFEPLLNSDINFDFSVYFNDKKETALQFLQKFLFTRLNELNPDKDIIDDFVNMSFILKEKIDCFTGKKKINQLHFEYSERIMLNSMRGKKFEIPDTPLRYLSLPDNYHIFKNKKAFSVEAMINKNCIASYIDKVIKGKCLCCSADIDGKHYSIEIVCRKKKNSFSFVAVQVRGKWNELPEPYVLEQIEQDLKNASPKAISLYMKKHSENM